MLGSYVISRFSGDPEIHGLPISFAIEPTTACNLKCPECPSGLRSFSRPTGRLDQPLFRQIIDELSPWSIYLTFYFQGEPYLNPQFLEMVNYASKQGLYTATSTNGHFLSEEIAMKTVQSGLDRIIVSIDGTTQEVYEQYRKEGSLNKVLEGTKNLVNAKHKLGKQSPAIVWQFLVVKPNQHQIEEVQALAKSYGVDKVALKTAQVYDYADGNDLIPTIDRFSRYRQQEDGSYRIKNKLLDHCWKMWSSCVITWDGKVVPCCFDKDAQHAKGGLEENSFQEVWFSPAYRQFRSQILKGRSKVEMCANCTEGTKVWA